MDRMGQSKTYADWRRSARGPLAGAALLLFAASSAHAVDGWATVGGGTTGGAGGPTVTVTNAADLEFYGTQTGPYIIQIQGTITMSTVLNPTSNKSFIGLGSNAKIDGGFAIRETGGVIRGNYIFRNLTITNPRGLFEGDGIQLKYNVHHVWVDHCTFVDCPDGMLDITNASDYVTVSWCKFYYTRDNGHNFVNLIAGGDDDAGSYRVTFHHNWYSTLCRSRMPAARFGSVHMYNNYYDCAGNNYCSNARGEAQFLSENNYYNGVKDALYADAGTNGKIRASSNTYLNCTGQLSAGTDTVFVPPYSYSLDATGSVPSIVSAGAGAGGGSATPTPTSTATPTATARPTARPTATPTTAPRSTPTATPTSRGGLPAAPTSLTATPGSRRITIQWSDNANNETGFQIERSTGGSFSPKATVGANVTSWTQTGLSAGSTYKYRVRATNASGSSAYSNEGTATVLP